jgi:pyruvate,orthophosphate dikinase
MPSAHLKAESRVVSTEPESADDRDRAVGVLRHGQADRAEQQAGESAVAAGPHKVFHTHTGREFPQPPHEQLRLAVQAVFRSWNAERAVVAMVFGNLGTGSGTGVAFTRDPVTCATSSSRSSAAPCGCCAYYGA